MIGALFLRKHRSDLGNAMNSPAAPTPAQRAWINALAPAVVLIAIALLGLLG
ncbi:hypothetical protein SAMN04489730_2514 [Amycolatopsis australiensis]|uniref:Uncharacterized protein n=1 Tax=Amycolatopsis australiensis TaxID=546364 RepID=A0A1K1R0B0_9PSEU|nr:hypothetical protein SAMN04489730_2514 [Amycolatopsis australiensis]